MKFSRYIRMINHPSGDGEIRTLDPLLARQVLSQLSYAPRSSYSISFLLRTSTGSVLRTIQLVLLFSKNLRFSEAIIL